MGIIRAMVRFPWDTGLEEHVTVNTFHAIFIEPTFTALEAAEDFAVGLTSFYGALDGIMSSIHENGQGEIRFYDLADEEPRLPILVEDLSTVSFGTTQAPPELALCLSIRGVYVSGQPRARRQGRLYLGPWSNSQLEGSNGRPTAALQSAVDDAATALLAHSASETSYAWAIYSRVGAEAHSVTGGWVDNEWDVQRRRGQAITVRNEFGTGH